MGSAFYRMNQFFFNSFFSLLFLIFKRSCQLFAQACGTVEKGKSHRRADTLTPSIFDGTMHYSFYFNHFSVIKEEDAVNAERNKEREKRNRSEICVSTCEYVFECKSKLIPNNKIK